MSFVQPRQGVPVDPAILGTSKFMPSTLHQDASLGSNRSKASSHDNSLSSSSCFEPGSVFDSPDGDCLLLADGGSSSSGCNPPAAELVSFMLDQAAAAAADNGFHAMDCSNPSLPELLLPAGDGAAALELQPLQANMSLSPYLCTGPPLPQSSINSPSALRDLASMGQSLQKAAAEAAAPVAAKAESAVVKGAVAAAAADAACPLLVPVPLPPAKAVAVAGGDADCTAQEEPLQVYKLMVLDEETGAPLREATLEDSFELEKTLHESRDWLCKGKGAFSWFMGSEQSGAPAGEATAKGEEVGKQGQQQQVVGEAVLEAPCCMEVPSQQQQQEEESSEGAAAKPALVRIFSSKCGGPCDHCGVKGSPQWRRGPPQKPMLCNACGTRFRRTHKLGPLPSGVSGTSAATKKSQPGRKSQPGKKRASSNGNNGSSSSELGDAPSKRGSSTSIGGGAAGKAAKLAKLSP